jgi:hypothetical protein
MGSFSSYLILAKRTAKEPPDNTYLFSFLAIHPTNTKDPNAKLSADRAHTFNALSDLLLSFSDKTPASTEPWNVRSDTLTFSSPRAFLSTI